MEVFEYPPILTGSVEEQLAQLLNERQEGGSA